MYSAYVLPVSNSGLKVLIYIYIYAFTSLQIQMLSMKIKTSHQIERQNQQQEVELGAILTAIKARILRGLNSMVIGEGRTRNSGKGIVLENRGEGLCMIWKPVRFGGQFIRVYGGE